MYSTAATLVKSATKFASPPEIYQKINQVINAPDSTVNDIAEVVARDPGVSVRVLRIVNSAYYGLPSKIDTITEGITTIGTRQLRDLVLATTVLSKFEGIPPEVVDLEEFWKHSLACALAARALAHFRHEPNLESYFVAGILHDLGRLVLFSRMPDQCIEVMANCRTSGQLLLEAERERFGYDHTDVGRELFRAWNLPPSLEDVAGCHHLPQKAAAANGLLVSIVHLADIIVHSLEIGNSGEPMVPEFSAHAWAHYGRSVANLARIYSETQSQFKNLMLTLHVAKR